MLIANTLDANEGVDAAARKRIDDRTAPVATVVTDAAALVKVAAPAAARAPMSGADVAAKVCAACHGSGALGAPKEKADWAKRKAAAGGVDGLAKSAIAGKNAMPPRGGDASLSDAEVKSAVEALLKQAGA
ncbi:MAG: cytochrome c [Gammaproteobacteria bacterium]|nr:cytochrome c [Gammaproteobacteria bacterium]